MTEKEIIIEKVNNIKTTYIEYMKKAIEQENYCIYYKTIMINSVLQRSLAIMDAYEKILPYNNIMVLNGLNRMQIDNCIFIYGIYLLYNSSSDINKIFKKIILENKQLKNCRVNGKKLSDFYIVSEIDKFQNNFMNMYKFYCRFIHFSDSAGLLAMEVKYENVMQFHLSTNYNRFDQNVNINAYTFLEISKLVLILIEKYWKDIENGTKIH